MASPDELTIGGYSLAQLIGYLEQMWQPSADDFLLGHSVGAESLDPDFLATLTGSVGPQPGDVAMSGADTKTGWLLCDGAAKSRTTFSALFGAIGTKYGVGDGSTTFNLPDLRQRSPVGEGAAGGLTPRNRGDVGGEEAHTLAAGEMPTHGHSVNDPGHGHGVNDPGHRHTFSTGGSAFSPIPAAGGSGTSFSNTDSTGTGITLNSAATGISISNAGGGGSHNNMPPFAVVNFFIKT